MVYNAGIEDRDSMVRRQSISTLCDCRCLLVTWYHAATISTDSIVTCLKSADNEEVMSNIISGLKTLKHEWYERALTLTRLQIAIATTLVATARASEYLSGG